MATRPQVSDSKAVFHARMATIARAISWSTAPINLCFLKYWSAHDGWQLSRCGVRLAFEVVKECSRSRMWYPKLNKTWILFSRNRFLCKQTLGSVVCTSAIRLVSISGILTDQQLERTISGPFRSGKVYSTGGARGLGIHCAGTHYPVKLGSFRNETDDPAKTISYC